MHQQSAILSRTDAARLPPFVVEVYQQTLKCRHNHQCYIMPFEHGPLLGGVAAACGKDRILELGTGLGYSTLWLAHGARSAHIDSIEGDPDHAKAARENFVKYGIAGQVYMYVGDFAEVLPSLEDGYDLVLFDGWEPELAHLAAFEHLIKPGGVLISSNLHYAGMPENLGVRQYCALLYERPWYTASWGDGNTAMSVRMT